MRWGRSNDPKEVEGVIVQTDFRETEDLIEQINQATARLLQAQEDLRRVETRIENTISRANIAIRDINGAIAKAQQERLMNSKTIRGRS